MTNAQEPPNTHCDNCPRFPMVILYRLQPPGHGGCMTQNNAGVFARGVGRRNSDRHCSAEYVAHGAPDEFRFPQTHGSREV